MAKGKKSKGNNYTSKGERASVSKNTIKLCKRSYSTLSKIVNITNHWAKGDNPWITIENPNKNETNKRFIKVKTNDFWGSPRRSSIKMRTE